MNLFLRPISLLLVTPFLACSSDTETISLGGSSNLTGTYTGVLQEGGGTAKAYVNLAETVTVSQYGPFQLAFSSSAFPTLTAVVLSTGTTAVNLDLVNYTAGTGIAVEQVGFVKDATGAWILVLQTAIVGDGSSPLAVQFASYDSADAPPATAVAATDYLEQELEQAESQSNK